jgi:RNA polymerase sigma-70 factor (ECF subfamily)
MTGNAMMKAVSSASKTALAFGAEASSRNPPPSPVEQEVLGLFDQLRAPLFRYLLSFSLTTADSEEIIQEIFLALFQHLQRGKSQLNLKGWLFRVAHNLALRKRRDDRRDPQSFAVTDVLLQELVIDPSLNPEDRLAASQKEKAIAAAVNALPEQDRRCLFLRAEGLRYREIAEVLEISISTVSVSLGRSLARIGRAAER